jgi:hypothetical protein
MRRRVVVSTALLLGTFIPGTLRLLQGARGIRHVGASPGPWETGIWLAWAYGPPLAICFLLGVGLFVLAGRLEH